MSVGLDSSVVLRLLVGQPADQALRAVALLDDLARQGKRATVSDLVAAEVYFALHHHYGVPKPEALAALRRMFAAGEVGSTGHATSVLATPGLATAKPGFVDRLIHAGYIAEGGTMASFEKAAGKMAGVQVL
jgi:predicted nucleic acid-binding protein